MKGLVLVDFPNHCVDCKFCREINEGTEACCEMTIDPDDYDCYRMIEDYCQSKPGWCPIKEIPSRKQVPGCFFMMDEVYGKEIGFNDCLDEIFGRGK